MSFPSSDDLFKPPTTDGKVQLVVHITAKSKEASAEVVKILKDIQKEAKASEKGTLTYRISVADTDPNTVLIYEEYVDLAALKQHTENPHFGLLMQKKDELTDGVHCKWYSEQ